MLIYEDFPLGLTIPLGPRTITREEMIEFAQEFDPQPFHVDEHSQQAKQVGGLIASGWHTSSILMRMMCDAYFLDTASQGSPGMKSIRWWKPVRPGDTLSGMAEVTGRRIAKSKPNLGLIDFNFNLDNQDGDTVITMVGTGMIDVAGRAT